MINQHHAPEAAASAYTLELLDSSQAVLTSQPFTPTEFSASYAIPPGAYLASRKQNAAASEDLTFKVTVPYNPATAALRVMMGAIEISRLSVSANPPTVAITAPTSGSQIGSQVSIQWTSSDPDGDELRHSVLYSPDSGVTWIALATQYEGSTLTLADTSEMPASAPGAGQLRVVAADGVHTAMDTITGLRVANHAPSAYLDDQQLFLPLVAR